MTKISSKYRIDDYRSPDEGSIITSITSKQHDDKALGIEFVSASDSGIRVQLEGHVPVNVGLLRIGFYGQHAAEVLMALRGFITVCERQV